MNRSNRIAVVDDEPGMREIIVDLLMDEGYEVAALSSGEELLAKVEELVPDVVLMDQNLPGMTGQDATAQLVDRYPATQVIILTAFGAIEHAVDAMRRGAYDYMTKPFDNDELLLRVRRAVEARALVREVEQLRAALGERYGFEAIVGESEALQEAVHTAKRVAASDAPVLVEGESGTGKELLVRAIHESSRRRGGPFVAVNCAAVAKDLVESEFFGHAKGAFTGSASSHAGFFAQADGGTLFLDEIGEMPIDIQPKLLRALEEHAVTPVGGERSLPVDVRVVAATNRSPETALREGQLRDDLYHRLAAITLHMPALRERPSDIPLLALHYLKIHRAETTGRPSSFSDAAMEALIRYPWPGNVRELSNAVQRAVILTDNVEIQLGDLPARVRTPTASTADGDIRSLLQSDWALPDAVATVERALIARMMKEEEGNRTRAAERLGITRKTLLAKARQYGLE